MSHTTARIPHRATAWSCTCGSEWRGDRKTCPTVRIRNNRRRKLQRQGGDNEKRI